MDGYVFNYETRHLYLTNAWIDVLQSMEPASDCLIDETSLPDDTASIGLPGIS